MCFWIFVICNIASFYVVLQSTFKSVVLCTVPYVNHAPRELDFVAGLVGCDITRSVLLIHDVKPRPSGLTFIMVSGLWRTSSGSDFRPHDIQTFLFSHVAVTSSIYLLVCCCLVALFIETR